MTDKKSLAIILGTAIGAAAVAAAISVHVHQNNQEPVVTDVNDVFEQARKTVKKLDEALDLLKKPAA